MRRAEAFTAGTSSRIRILQKDFVNDGGVHSLASFSQPNRRTFGRHVPMLYVNFKSRREFKNTHLQADSVWHVFLVMSEAPKSQVVVAHERPASTFHHMNFAP